MKANRRGFLGLLGIGAVSAPLAAKAAAESEMMKLTALSNNSTLALGAQAMSSGIPDQAFGMKGEYQSPYIKVNQYLKLWGKLPDFVIDNLKERAKCVGYLDPDIACKRSWSLNVKIQAQRERNFENELKRYRNSGKYDAAQSAFRKLTGWEWPW